MDKIAEILTEVYRDGLQASKIDTKDIAKQIRQLIGRELLSKADLYGDKEGVYTAVKAMDIREVCKLDEG